MDGTAKAQIMTYYLQQASPRESIERRAMEAKIAYLESQVEANKNDVRIVEMIADAMESLREYRGEGPNEDIY